LLNETLFPGPAYHHRFRPFDAAHGVLLAKDLEIHVIELTKFDVPAEAVQTPLERWCYVSQHGAALDLASLPAALDVPVIRKAVEVLVKLSQEERERHWAEERLRAQRDAANLAATARDARQIGFDEGFEEGRDKGIEEGIEKGMKEGVEKGRRIGSIQLLQQLLQQPETSSAELNRLPEQELVQMEAALKQQLTAKKQANGPTPPGPTP
jgi:hypothetical protein